MAFRYIQGPTFHIFMPLSFCELFGYLTHCTITKPFCGNWNESKKIFFYVYTGHYVCSSHYDKRDSDCAGRYSDVLYCANVVTKAQFPATGHMAVTHFCIHYKSSLIF